MFIILPLKYSDIYKIKNIYKGDSINFNGEIINITLIQTRDNSNLLYLQKNIKSQEYDHF